MSKDVCQKRGADYYDYSKYEVKFGHQSEYEIIDRIGWGKFADVFQGIDSKTDKDVAIKILKPVQKNKIRREVKIMQILNNGPNIITFIDIVWDPATKTPAIVTEYVNCLNPLKVWNEMKLEEVKFYLFELLKAIDHVHS